MKAKLRVFLIVWSIGFIGILSLLLVDVSAVISMLPIAEPVELPPPLLLKTLTIFQPTVLMSLAALIGVSLANRVGLHAPATEAAAAGEPFLSKLKPQVLPGVLTGVVTGVVIVCVWLAAKQFLSPDLVSRAEAFNKLMPAATRFLYGGITEEILLRWGLMTFLVWLPWRLFHKGDGEPKSLFVAAAIFISAIVFGVGHLPVASLLAGGLTFPLVAYVIAANSAFGIAAGFLYWKRGLESAMIAHMAAHIVLIAAIALAL